MIDISSNTHGILYFDYQKGLDFLKNIDYSQYSYPEGHTNFHIYTDLNNDKEIECIKSFLATQNLDKCKLFVWSDNSLENNKLIQPYKDLVILMIYNPKEQAKDTVLENHPVWINSDISDAKYYMKSGLLRFLVTYNYGGIWSDMDMIFLRDFKPILDQEWAYMWGSETDFINFGPCAAMMNFKKRSRLSSICLEEIYHTRLIKDSTVLDHLLLAKVYRRMPFTVFPSTFFNTEWLISKTRPNFRKQVGHGFDAIATEEDYLFLDAFAWHWHNSSNKDRVIAKNSKFEILRNITNNRLKDKGIL